MPDRRIRTVIADDHPMYREGLAETLRRRAELDLVGEAADGREALELMRDLRPDVCVLDIQMPGLDGMQVMRALTRDALPTRAIFLSAHFGSEVVYAALGAGAAGFLSKDAGGGAICDAIAAVARGETVLGADVQRAVADEIRRRDPFEGSLLTEREREVLRLASDGLSAPDVAAHLHLSPATVKTHLQRAYEKLGVSDRAAAVKEAMRRGLLE